MRGGVCAGLSSQTASASCFVPDWAEGTHEAIACRLLQDIMHATATAPGTEEVSMHSSCKHYLILVFPADSVCFRRQGVFMMLKFEILKKQPCIFKKVMSGLEKEISFSKLNSLSPVDSFPSGLRK